MNLVDIAKLRLANQHIGRDELFPCPSELLGHMGALQAQDHAMAKCVMGVRLPIEAAIERGEIIRTHLAFCCGK